MDTPVNFSRFRRFELDAINVYRTILILASGGAISACSTGELTLDSLKPSLVTDSVHFESKPPGATVKISQTQSCVTPCALDLPVNQATLVEFSLTGYRLETKTLQPKVGTNIVQLDPNPLSVDLAPDQTIKKEKTAVQIPWPSKPASVPTSPPPPVR